MAVNLVSLIMQFLTPDMIGRIASALGLDRNNTQTAIGAAIPGLLAGLSGVAAQPGGAQKLVDTVRQQTGALGSFANMIGASGQSSLIEKGSQILSSLLGGRDQTALAGAVSKYAGLGQNASGSLLGMLAPIVMGTIGTGLLDSLGGAARTATAAAGQTARVTTSAARAIGDTGQRAAAVSLNWLYWLIPLLAIVALLIYFFARPAEQVVQPSVPTIPSLTVGGLDIGKQVTDSITNLRTTLTGITDVSSAQTALPKLREVTAQIDRVDGLLGQLSPEQRKVLAGVVNPLMPSLNQLFDKVLAIPGVAELLKPTIDALRAKLTLLTA